VAHLTNIATPTPFTFTDTNYVFDCATDPTTVSVWYTLDVAGTQYPGEFGNVLTYSAAPTVFATYTFPALIVTQFTPGEEVTVVGSQLERRSVMVIDLEFATYGTDWIVFVYPIRVKREVMIDGLFPRSWLL